MSSRRTRSSTTSIKNESDGDDSSLTVRRQSTRTKKESTTLEQVTNSRIPRLCRTRSNTTLSGTGNGIDSKPTREGDLILSSLESCTSSVVNDLDLIPENDPHYIESSDDVFEKNSDSLVSPEKVDMKPLRRSTRAASIASSEKKPSDRNRSVTSKDTESTENKTHDYDPKPTQRGSVRVTRSSSFATSDTSDLDESVSLPPKSARRTPARRAKNENLNVIKEESLENTGIDSVTIELPVKNELPITPSRRGRSAKTTRSPARKISASPPRLTRAMRAAGVTTPVQEKELDIVQSTEMLENANESAQTTVEDEVHVKGKLDLETPVRNRNEKFSESLINVLMHSTRKEKEPGNLLTTEVKLPLAETMQSVVNTSTPVNVIDEVEDMDWEPMDTPVSQKKKRSSTSSSITTPPTQVISEVDYVNVYTPLITKSSDEHERFVEVVTQSVEKANEIMRKGNTDIPRKCETNESEDEPVNLVNETSVARQHENCGRNVKSNEACGLFSNEDNRMKTNSDFISIGKNNNNTGLYEEVDINKIDETTVVMERVIAGENLTGSDTLSTVVCNPNFTVSEVNDVGREGVISDELTSSHSRVEANFGTERGTTKQELDISNASVSNHSEEYNVLMKENENNHDSEALKTRTVPAAKRVENLDKENVPVLKDQLTESEKQLSAKNTDTTLTLVSERPNPGDETDSSSAINIVDYYPQIHSFKQLFKKPKTCHHLLETALPLLYTFACGLKRRIDDLPSTFLNKNDETVWQFIAYRNKQISKEYRKRKDLLDENISSHLAINSDEDEENEIEHEDENEIEHEDEEKIDDDEEEDVDLFNLKDEDLHDLERHLEEETGYNREEGGNNIESVQKSSDVHNLPRVRYPKSAVDDKFFSLAEMDAFLDEAEKQNDEEILATVDDSWGDTTDYRYEDFFGKLEDVITNDKQEKKEKKIKRKAINEDSLPVKKKKKTVRFALNDSNGNEVESVMESKDIDDTDSQPVLPEKNAEEGEKKESSLKRSLKKLKETIKKLEEENLAPRSWELSGEVTGQQREENTLLEAHVQFDHGAKKAPEITEDFTEKLEGIIKQRIKDKTFDDVVRKRRVEERVEIYRNQAIEENEMMKKSLTEVYEKEYLKATGEVKDDKKPNEQHEAIEMQMKELFRLVDALSHYEYTPPEVRPEVKVVSNLSALRIEEVGMMASTEAQLLAPEEIKRKKKGIVKADDERDRTDKLRQRRKKKNKQRAMVMIMGESAVTEQKRKNDSKITVNIKSNDAIKSSTFFNKLQETVQQELKEKTTRKKKVKSEVVQSGGSKFKL